MGTLPAPKKEKAQKMQLGEFLTDTCMHSRTNGDDAVNADRGG